MNRKFRVLVVFGTRPDAIKLVPIVKALKDNESIFDVYSCVTAQHREMLDQILVFFSVIPNFDLNIMKKNQSLFEITTSILEKLDKILNDCEPDLLIVQGDTTTTFVASLAAFYKKIQVGHVEAGLRTYDSYNPFPEEMNRKLTDSLSNLFFVATENARYNLIKENVAEDNIYITGNTVIDSLFLTIEKINKLDERKFFDYFQSKNFSIDLNKKIILVTGHRRESFGHEFENICNGIKKLSLYYHDIEFVYPVHLNPNVKEPVYRILSGIQNVYLLAPLDYLFFVWLMNKSFIILTDSGGIQEEAPALSKPVLVMRERTERNEAVNCGSAKLVGTNEDVIFKSVQKLIENPEIYNKMANAGSPYGDGTAAMKTITSIKTHYKLNL